MRFATATIMLGLTYLILTGSASAKNCLVALLLGAAITWMSTRKGWSPGTGFSANGRALLVFVGAITREVFRGTLTVVKIVLGRREPRVGIVEVPIAGRSERGVAVSGLVATLAPGTVLVDVDEERKVMVVSAIDASDPEAVRAEIQGFYQRYQKPILP